MALTEEELAFMNEHMGADNSPGDSEVVGGSVSVASCDCPYNKNTTFFIDQKHDSAKTRITIS